MSTDEQLMFIRVDVETAKREVEMIDREISKAGEIIRRQGARIAELERDRRAAERRIEQGEAKLNDAR